MDTILVDDSLFSIPALQEDGSNWFVYKFRLLTLVDARGLTDYLDGRASKPLPFAVREDGATVLDDGETVASMAEIKERKKEIDEHRRKDAIVRLQLYNTISDSTLLRIGNLKSAPEAWKKICAIYEGRMEVMQSSTRMKLFETRCKEGGDVKAHFAELLNLREMLTCMGAAITDEEFYAIIATSLPNSYQLLVSSIVTTSTLAGVTLRPERLMDQVVEEYERRQYSQKRGDSALSPKPRRRNRNVANMERRGKQNTANATEDFTAPGTEYAFAALA